MNINGEETIKKVLIRYLYKSRSVYFRSSFSSFEYSKTIEEAFLTKKEYASYDQYLSNNLINYPFLDDVENQLLNTISFYIEQGYQDYYKLVSNSLGISLEEMKEMLEKVKEKISNQGLVKK